MYSKNELLSRILPFVVFTQSLPLYGEFIVMLYCGFVLLCCSVESMFMQDDGVFDKMIDTVYKETSQHLLHVLHVNYKFMDHLKVNTPHPTECYII